MDENVKLIELLQSFHAISEQLSIALKEVKNPFVRDSAVLRFELCFELFWKILREFARGKGLIVNSPKDSVRIAFQLGAVDNDRVYLEMIDTRNLLVHTYDVDYAEEIYKLLPDYSMAMNKAIAKLKQLI